ncbi:hypothetical protein E2C01_039983 [Portunus trituberculatus]|uniref:Uncharacterized protein n=1 Tax=Portunus trituberculatus TaxID=210409 RepID=A0A5B7FM34_PORTR|nr:hypothetical protein [Portunus trituberculatus]
MLDGSSLPLSVLCDIGKTEKIAVSEPKVQSCLPKGLHTAERCMLALRRLGREARRSRRDVGREWRVRRVASQASSSSADDATADALRMTALRAISFELTRPDWGG